MYTSKILTDLCFIKQKTKIKNGFVKVVQCFSCGNVLIKHKENCLSINGKQSVKLGEIIKFENYFKQIPVPLKIYADSECNLKKVKCDEGSYTEKYQDHIPCSSAYKIVCIDNKFTKLLYIGVKMQRMNLLKQFLKNINIAKK